MATPSRIVLATALVSAALAGCTAHYVYGRDDAIDLVGNRIGQFEVRATYDGCSATAPASGPISVECVFRGPGAAPLTSNFEVGDVGPDTWISSAAGAILLQVPVSVTGLAGTYAGPSNGPLRISELAHPLAADNTRWIVAETGTKLFLIENPPEFGTFQYNVAFTQTGDAPVPMPLKVLMVGRVESNGLTWYPPLFPCTHDMAKIPPLRLPTLDYFAPIDLSPMDGLRGCQKFLYRMALAVEVVEFYHQGLDHYFITWGADELAALDAGTAIKGWARTGHRFKAFVVPQSGAQDVCRYYIPPELGDSHFFGRGAAECADTKVKFPALVEEAPKYMQMVLPVAGVCPAGFVAVYRVFSNRADANHRHMTDKALRDLMVAAGWVAEGDGPDRVVMCAPA